MNNAIVQFNIDSNCDHIFNYARSNTIKKSLINKTNSQIFDYSKKSFELYCRKYNIEHIIVTEPKINHKHPTWERLDLWFNDTWFEKYSNICYVDTDVFAMPWAKNIFNELEDDISFHRIPHLRSNEDFFNSLNPDRVRECFFQAGVILLNKNVINATKTIIMDKYKEPVFTDDSVILNYAIITSDIKVKNINETFNVKLKLTKIMNNVNFLHAFGRLKDTDPEGVINLLRRIFAKEIFAKIKFQ